MKNLFEDFQDFEIEYLDDDKEDDKEQDDHGDDTKEQDHQEDAYVAAFLEELNSLPTLEDKERHLSEEIHKLESLVEGCRMDKKRYQECKYEMSNKEFLLLICDMMAAFAESENTSALAYAGEYMGFKVEMEALEGTPFCCNIIISNGNNKPHYIYFDGKHNRIEYILLMKKTLETLDEKALSCHKKLEKLYQLKL